MPRIVDHQERRRLVAEATIRLLAEHGLDGVKVREVADATGFSTAVVSHYFADKRDLLLFTYRYAAERADQRLDAIDAAGGTDLMPFLEAFLPLDEERRRHWTVWVAFWGKAVADPEFSAEQRRWALHARARIAARLRAAGNAGDCDAPARSLLSAIIGISTQAAFDPRDWPAEVQRAVLDRGLGIVLADDFRHTSADAGVQSHQA